MYNKLVEQEILQQEHFPDDINKVYIILEVDIIVQVNSTSFAISEFSTSICIVVLFLYMSDEGCFSIIFQHYFSIMLFYCVLYFYRS